MNVCLPCICGNGWSALLFDLTMHPLEALRLRRRRRRLVRRATGRVLEVGTGTGVNLPFFGWDQIDELTLVDLAFPPGVRRYGFPDGITVRFCEQSVEELPFADNSFDSVVFSLLFCTVTDNRRGLAELYRVLAPGGRVCFIEHVLPRHPLLRIPMRAANPLWRRFSNGCNLTRDTVLLLQEAGFAIEQLEHHAGGILVSGTALKPAADPPQWVCSVSGEHEDAATA